MTATRYRLTFLLLALIGVAMLLYAVGRYGAGLSPDSIGYISAARSIVGGHGAANYDGSPLVAQPPLYPFLLAAVQVVSGADPVESSGVIAAVLFGIIIYLSGLLFAKCLPSSPLLVIMGTISVVVSIPMILTFVTALSEAPFVCFVVLFLVAAESYRSEPRRGSLLLMAVSAALACLTRYVGCTLIVVGAAMLLIQGKDWRGKYRNALIFLLVSLLPIGLWLVRNYAVSGTFFGPRASSYYTLSDNLGYASTIFINWYFLAFVARSTAAHSVLVAVILVAVILRVRAAWIERAVRLRPTDVSFGLSLVFAAFIIISSTLVAYNQISTRLMLPIYVPAMILLVTAAQSAGRLLQKAAPARFAPWVVSAVIALWLVYPTAKAVYNLRRFHEAGGGISGQAWRSSETISFLRSLPVSECAVVYTNDPWAIYHWLGSLAELSPQRTEYNSPDVVSSLPELTGRWPSASDACLVWFPGERLDSMFTPDELSQAAMMTQIAALKDGVVYKVSRRE